MTHDRRSPALPNSFRSWGCALVLWGSGALAVSCSSDPVKVKVDESPTPTNMTTGLVQGDAPAPVNAACVTQTTAAEPRNVSLYMMLDSSGSMLDASGGNRNKWDSVTSAIRGFLAETSDLDLQVGLQFFPLAKPGSRFNCSVESDCGPDADGDGISDGGPCFLKRCRAGNQSLCATESDCPGGPIANPCLPFGVCSGSSRAAPTFCELLPGQANLCTDSLGVCLDINDRPCTNATNCNADAYAAPAVEIGLVSQNFPLVDQALKFQTPQGLTPTAPALKGAIDHAREFAASHPDETVVVLLATDGLPTHCGPTTNGLAPLEPIDTVAEIAASGLSGNNPVRTFVFGVFEPGDTSGIANLDEIAQAGGTERAAIIDSSGEVDEQFLDALRAIRSGQLGCEFQLPTSTAPLDYLKVNLQFRSGASAQQLPFVRDGAGCNATSNGWHYDVDPNQSKPSSIQVCPDVCSKIKAADSASASIQMQLGCATIIR